MTDASRAAYVFSSDERKQFERELEKIDLLLRRLAQKYGLDVLSDGGRGWPGRTLYRRSIAKTYYLRLTLESTSLDTGLLAWNLHDVWMYEVGSFFRKVISSRTLAEQINDLGAESVRQVIDEALRLTWAK